MGMADQAPVQFDWNGIMVLDRDDGTKEILDEYIYTCPNCHNVICREVYPYTMFDTRSHLESARRTAEDPDYQVCRNCGKVLDWRKHTEGYLKFRDLPEVANELWYGVWNPKDATQNCIWYDIFRYDSRKTCGTCRKGKANRCKDKTSSTLICRSWRSFRADMEVEEVSPACQGWRKRRIKRRKITAHFSKTAPHP